MWTLRRSAPQADFQARWNFDQKFSSIEECEQAIAAYNRLRRFALQSAAVAALPKNKALRECLRVNHKPQVDVMHSPTRGAAFYRGLNTCGSVWCCAVCAAKVSERRRQELGQGIKAWKAKGGVVWLVTLTFSHSCWDRLRELTKRFAAALKRFNSGEAAKLDRELFGIVGQVRALEVTHSDRNGWHPHLHMLVFVQGEDTHTRREELRARMFDRWERACRASGLGLPNEKHGVRVDGGELAGEYVTKWGLESELTKHVVKQGRGHSRTPMAILGDFLDDGDMADAELFAEYAEAFKGHPQLRWSKGLRDLLELGQEVSDKDVADADEAQVEDKPLAGISLPVWRLVRKYDVRGQLLAIARRGDAELVNEFLEYLIELETG